MAERVAIIGTVGLPAKYGGFETLADHLVQKLGSRVRFTVYCSAKSYEKRPATYLGARLVYVPLKANGAQSILYDIVSIAHAWFTHDVLLVLGVSGAVALPVVGRLGRAKTICHIDGLEWKRPKWNRWAARFLRFSEGVAVRHAHAVIADNAVIGEHVREAYGSPSELIAYGGDHAVRVPVDAGRLAKYPFLASPYAFSVCRIEPENNIHVILEAFAGLDRRLVLVGNWNGSAYARGLRERYGKVPNLSLLDPIYDAAELGALRGNCAVYVHGHSAGGTNPSLVEAMHLGLPVMAFDVAYNVATTDGAAFYFRDAEGLRALLAGTDPGRLAASAERMRALAAERYTWAKVAERYRDLIERVRGRKP